MRTIVLIALFGLICLSQAEVLKGSIVTFTSQGELKQSSQVEYFQYNDLINLYKHSMGLPLNHQEKSSEKFVTEYQRGDIFKPSQMNYIVVMEGLKQEDSESVIPRQKKILFNINQQTEGKKLMETVYDSRDSQSINYLLQQNYQSNEDLSMYYFTMSNLNNKYFQNFGVSIQQTEDKKMQLVDFATGNKIQKSMDIQQCFKEHLNNQFFYLSEKNMIVKKNNNLKLEINEQNFHDISVMIEEMCGSLQFTKALIVGERPNLVTFHFSSLKSLSQKLSSEQLVFVQDMWKTALNLLINNLEKTFGESTLGSIIYTEAEQVQKYILESGNLEQIPHNLEFAEMKSSTLQDRRVLQDNADPVRTTNYQIRVWFSIFFGVLIYFVLYALVTAKNDRDSLLYAKFLTNDIKN